MRPTPLQDERSLEAVKIYRGWDAFERRHGRVPIIDIDLTAGHERFTYSSHSEILQALLRAYDRFDLPTGTDAFIRTRLQASVAFLQAQMGEQRCFRDYLKLTLGNFPEPCPEDYLRSLRGGIDDMLARYNLTYSPKDTARFNAELMLRESDKIFAAFQEEPGYWLDLLRAASVPTPKNLRFQLTRTSIDAPWNTWLSKTQDGSFRIEVNLHPRRQYDRGRPLLLFLHEVCGHLVQRLLWESKIAARNLDPALGTTIVHSPEALLSEGLAQTVTELLRPVCAAVGRDLPNRLLLSREMQYHEHLVFDNAHLMLFDGRPITNVFAYVCDHLPFISKGSVESELRDRGTNLLSRSYQLTYGTGQRTMRKALQQLDVEQQRILFQELYLRPMLPAQLPLLVTMILRGRSPFDENS